MATVKVERLNIRASEFEKSVLMRAAKVSRVSISQFVLQQALDAAERVLSDQTRFVLSGSEFEKFCQLLDAPVRDLPAVRKLSAESSPWHEE